MRKVGIGIVGAGSISELYLANFRTRYEILEPVFIADMDLSKAEAAAKAYNISKFGTVDQLLTDPAVEIVLNITNPPAHNEINFKALNAGKHVYCEKTFAATVEEGKETIALAEEKGLMLGCAPDTFLGSSWQTARKLLDDGWIGKPLSVNACWCSRGHENWHPNPAVSYQAGVGPLMDNGVYAIQQIVAMLGPIGEVYCKAKKTFDKRIITSMPNKGQEFDVNCNTHYDCMFTLQNGMSGTATFSFDTWYTYMPYFEVHGTEGSMRMITSCDFYNGPVRLIRGEQILDDIAALPGHMRATRYMHADLGPDLGRDYYGPFHMTQDEKENMRSLGLNDMAMALVTGGKHRTSSQMALHTLDVLLNAERSAVEGRSLTIGTTCEELPEPMPVGGLVK